MMANTDRSTSCDNERIYPTDSPIDTQKKQTPLLDRNSKKKVNVGGEFIGIVF